MRKIGAALTMFQIVPVFKGWSRGGQERSVAILLLSDTKGQEVK